MTCCNPRWNSGRAASLLNALQRQPCLELPPVCRFMTVNTAIEQLLEVEQRRGDGAYSGDTLCVGVARLGSEQQQIVAGPMSRLQEGNFGPPLHSLIIAGTTHHVEDEILNYYMLRT